MDPSSNEQTELIRAMWNDMKALGTNFNARLEAVRTELIARMDVMQTELGARIEGEVASVRSDLGVRIDQTNARLFILEGLVRDLAGQQLLLGRYVKNELGEVRTRVGRLETHFPEPEEG